MIKQSVRAGQPLPDVIQNAPELLPGLTLYLCAFFDLDGERSHAFGPTPIPFSAINAYANAFRFTDEQKEDLLFFIRVMDAENLKRIKSLQTTPGKTK